MDRDVPRVWVFATPWKGCSWRIQASPGPCGTQLVAMEDGSLLPDASSRVDLGWRWG